MVMSFRWFVLIAAGVTGGAVLADVSARAAPVLEFASASLGTGVAATLGWSFTTNEAVEVTALDAALINAPAGNEVVLYNGQGSILASATLTSSDAKEGAPFAFYTQAIAPVKLAADTTYYVAERFPTASEAYVLPSGLVTNGAITFGNSVGQASAGGAPVTEGYGFGGGQFGPDFDVAVPEPDGLAVLAAGMIGFAAVRRRGSA
jgi:hypothetical protein